MRHVIVLLMVLSLLLLCGCADQGQGDIPPELLVPDEQEPSNGTVATPGNGQAETPVEGPSAEEIAARVHAGIGDCLGSGTNAQIDACLIALGKLEETTVVCESVKLKPRELCVEEIAVTLNNYGMCAGINKVNVATRCCTAIAKATNDGNACAAIPAGASNDDKDACWDYVARAVNNTLHCEMLSTENKENLCYKAIASSTGKQEYCELLSLERKGGIYPRDDCYLGVGARSMYTCSKVLDANRQADCYYDYAIGNNDANSCRILSDVNRMGECLTLVAKSTGELELCDGLVGDVNRETCRQTVSTSSPSEAGCTALKTSAQKDDCFKDLASSESDWTLCKKILDTGKRNTCLDTVGRAALDGNSCAAISKTEFAKRDGCFKAVAEGTKDPVLCGNVQVEAAYKECYNAVAKAMDEIGVCALATRGFWGGVYSAKDLCYYNFATAKNDKAFCDFIVSGDLKKTCIGSIGGFEESYMSCDTYFDEEDYIGCYSDAAIAAKDMRICGYATRVFSGQQHSKADECRYNLAINFNDIYYCQDIVEDSYQGLCIETIEG